MPDTFSRGRISLIRVRGSSIRSAYALAWLRKLSHESRFSSAGVSSGQATLRLYSSLGRASGENHQAMRAATTASA